MTDLVESTHATPSGTPLADATNAADATHVTRSEATAGPVRSPWTRLRSVLVTIAGVLGIVCVLWWVVAQAAGLSLIVVTTGSMSPTIPTGSVVVSHHEPAADVRPGDVVTVPRPGADLPVTHRVVTVRAVPGDASARSLTLRGDANATDDRDAYVVRTVGHTVASAPGLGSALTVLSQPAVRGLGVAVVGLLVVWTFWPARRPRVGDARSGADGDAPTLP